jgi:hypothetical protein
MRAKNVLSQLLESSQELILAMRLTAGSMQHSTLVLSYYYDSSSSSYYYY